MMYFSDEIEREARELYRQVYIGFADNSYSSMWAEKAYNDYIEFFTASLNQIYKVCKLEYEKNGKIAAIKKYRSVTGTKLLQAKEQIEEWAVQNNWKG